MAYVQTYLDLIPALHYGKPKFMATVSATVQPMVDTLTLMEASANLFDIDTSDGKQLDIVGVRVGASRQVNLPIEDVFFTYDVENLGFDQGILIGEYDPSQGLTTLDDDTYRLLMKAKAAANHWDGTLYSAQAIFDNLLVPLGVRVFLRDNQDMSVTVLVAGVLQNAATMAVVIGGYLPLKTAGVQWNWVKTTLAFSTPLDPPTVIDAPFSQMFPNSTGTVLSSVVFDAVTADTDETVWQIDDGTDDNALRLAATVSASGDVTFSLHRIVAGVDTATAIPEVFSAGDDIKVAVAFGGTTVFVYDGASYTYSVSLAPGPTTYRVSGRSGGDLGVVGRAN